MPSNLGAAIYGLITVGALLSAESTQRETYPATVAAVTITLLIYWLAHSYADFTSWRLEENKRIALDDLARMMVRQLPILFGAAIPLVTLVAAWAVGSSLATAVTAAIWASAATILIVEILAALRSHQSGRALVLQTSIGALLGALIIALRLVLH
jgi:hypothetical protein